MTTYKEIFGKYVKNYSSDPSSDIEGQVWYNSTTGVFKTNLAGAAAWAAGGNLGTARRTPGGAGTQTAGLAFAGFTTAVTAATEEYDGSAWTTGGTMSTARYVIAGCGTQTAGLAFGGVTGATFLSVTEEYTGPTLVTKTITTSTS